MRIGPKGINAPCAGLHAPKMVRQMPEAHLRECRAPPCVAWAAARRRERIPLPASEEARFINGVVLSWTERVVGT